MKKITTVFVLSLVALMMFAVPAKQGARVVTLSDGSQLTVFAHGDEFVHWLTDADGNIVEEQEDGTYAVRPAMTDAEIEARAAGSKRMQAARRMRHLPSNTQMATPLNLAPRGLIILAGYSDKAFETDYAEIDSMINALDYSRSYSYTYYGTKYNISAKGSARQYFIDQSMGQYQPYFDVVGPYTVSKTLSYYGKNDSNGDDQHVDELIIEACRKADTAGVDFSQYDNNNDGEIDFVFVIYAGYGEADGGASNTVWPHAFWIKDGYGYGFPGSGLDAVVLDGKTLNTYACANEINYGSGKHNGIGTFCHEFSHVLGLPDLYATNNASHRTLSDWDILDAGPYNNDGNTPPAYSAYERFFCGWLTPEILNSECSPSLEDLKTSNKAFIITSTGASNLIGNDPNPVEFYIIENRQQTSWDKYLAGHGMMLTKINYSYDAWYNNTVNNSSKSMRVDMIEAKANTGKYSSGADLFPKGATSYTPYDNYPITNIAEKYGVISFDFMKSDALEDIEVPDNVNAMKVYHNGQIFVFRDGQWYDVFGRKVERND